MRRLLWMALTGLCAGCTSGYEEEAIASLPADTPVHRQLAIDSHEGFSEETIPLPVPKRPAVQAPAGIYELPAQKNHSGHIVRFAPDRRFTMQYTTSPDSVKVDEGTWAVSDGYIWLYKNNIAWGRYRWKGDTLQYFDPSSQKAYAMQKRSDIMENGAWKNKPAEGYIMFGVGTEPFWSVGFTRGDSLELLMADAGKALRLPVTSRTRSGDSVLVEAGTDSTAIRMILLPRFCSDGMSDNIYSQQVVVQYKGQTLKGCGVKF
jgi:uncharacterized membrane protein